MPWSADEGKEYAQYLIAAAAPRTVLDIGAGAGYYGTLLKRTLPNAKVDAVEIWEPYITRFNLHKIYRQIYIQDARTFTPEQRYDVIVFGDVLEHMTKSEAISLVTRAKNFTHNIVISLPIIEWHQGAEEGNPYEAHVHHWDDAQIREAFNPRKAWTGDHIGVYLLNDQRRRSDPVNPTKK